MYVPSAISQPVWSGWHIYLIPIQFQLIFFIKHDSPTLRNIKRIIGAKERQWDCTKNIKGADSGEEEGKQVTLSLPYHMSHWIKACTYQIMFFILVFWYIYVVNMLSLFPNHDPSILMNESLVIFVFLVHFSYSSLYRAIIRRN